MASLFRAPATPQVAAAAPMPDPTSPAVIEAGKTATAAAMSRSGRASTIMGRRGRRVPRARPSPQRPATVTAGRLSARARPLKGQVVKQRVQELISVGDILFAKKIPILSLWQSISEQFDPMRADYTYVRSIGMEFYSHLMTGAAVMASRDLANAINAMLRPPGSPGFMRARNRRWSITIRRR